MEQRDKLKLAAAAAPILFSTSGVSNPLAEPHPKPSAPAYEDPEDDYLANAMAQTAVSVGKAMYPAVKQAAVDLYPAAKQAAVDLYPAVRDSLVEAGKSTYTAVKEKSSDYLPRTSSSRSRGIDIHICDPVVKEERMLSKYVVYTVRGQDSSGSFETFRRYSDFMTLRAALVRKWPGVYIPAIPPKQLIVLLTQGNLTTPFIEDRRVMLEDFLKRLVVVEFLLVSEEFQLFIRGTPDFEKECAGLKMLTYPEIAANFTNHFSRFGTSAADPMPKLAEEEKFLTEASIRLKRIKDVAKRTKEQYGAFQESYNALTEDFEWIEGKYLRECIGRDYRQLFRGTKRETLVNPYGFLYDWIKCELLDCRATIEAISKIHELESLKTRQSNKLETDKNDLIKLQAGKTLLSHVLTFKSRANGITSLEKDVEQLTDETQSLGVIIRIAGCRLVEFELPRVKEAKEEVYAAAMRKFARISALESEELGKAFRSMDRD